MSPTGDLHVTLIFLWGGVSLELAQGPSRVALAWHSAGSSTPFGVTMSILNIGSKQKWPVFLE